MEYNSRVMEKRASKFDKESLPIIEVAKLGEHAITIESSSLDESQVEQAVPAPVVQETPASQVQKSPEPKVLE